VARELAAALAENRSPRRTREWRRSDLIGAADARGRRAGRRRGRRQASPGGNAKLLAVEAKSAEATLATAVDRLLVAEAEAIAVEIERLEAQALALREQLVPLPPVSRPHEDSQLCGVRNREPRAGTAGLFRGEPRASNGIGERAARQRLLQHGKNWEARRVLLIAGDGTDAKDAEEAA